MEPSITCPRHRILSRFSDDAGHPVCKLCCDEAVSHAQEVALEAKVRSIQRLNEPSLTQSSAAWLLANADLLTLRLRW